MFYKLLLLFTVTPLVELGILFKVAAIIGGWETFSLVILTGILGSIMARREGIRTFRQIQHELDAGRVPTVDIVGAFLVFAAGLLLVTPGLLTDIAGFLVLIPPIRGKAAGLVLRNLQKHLHFTSLTGTEPDPDHAPAGTEWDDPRNEVIEVEVIKDEDD